MSAEAGRGTSPSDECPVCGVLARNLPCIDWRGEVMATPHAGRGPVAGRSLSSTEEAAMSGEQRWGGSGIVQPFSEWYDALTPEQQEQLRAKARWERMSLRAVAKEWGVDA